MFKNSSSYRPFKSNYEIIDDPGDQILLKTSKCSESLQIERECRPRRYKPNATHLGSNGRRERGILRSVQIYK